MDPAHPETWTPPAGPWHPDFDPHIEFAMLRTLATDVLKADKADAKYDVRLEINEPGYAHVVILHDSAAVAEVHVVLDGRGGYRYGLFGLGVSENVEEYFTDPREGVRIVTQIREDRR